MNGPLAMTINGLIAEKTTNLESPSGNGAGKAPQDSHRNPVCLEVTVGVRNMPSGPALAEGRSVIVFETGAVIRLAGNPPVGQLLVAINPHGREVACRVVAPRNRPALKGYIEIEFCEPAGDFWGIHPNFESANAKPSAEPSAVPAPPAFIPPARTIPTPPLVTSPAVDLSKLTGHAPTFDDIPGLSLDAPVGRPPVGAGEVRPRTRVSDVPAFTPEPSRPVGPASITSLSEVPTPDTTQSLKPHVTSAHFSQGKGMTGTSALPEPRSAGSRMPLIIGAAAVVLVVGAAGFFFLHNGSSPSGNAVSSPVVQNSGPAAQPALGSSQQDQPVQSATTRVPTPELNTSAPSAATSNSGEIVRPASETTATFADNNRAKSATPATALPAVLPSAPQRQSTPSQIANLKISAPKAPARNAGNSSDAANLSAAEIGSANPVASSAIGGMLTAPASSNVPAPPRPEVPATPAKSVVREPKMLSSMPPVYPPMAKQNNIQGDVILVVNVDANGKVGEMAVMSGPELLRRAAVDAVKNWRYQPATNNGNPVSAQVTVKVEFRIR